ncbi:MAG: GspMb/PilO family protein [Blastocatellia bacterium]
MKNIPVLNKLRTGYFRLIEIFAIVTVITVTSFTTYLAITLLKKENDKITQLQKQSLELKNDIKEIKTELKDKKSFSNSNQSIVDNLISFQEKFLRDPQKGRLVVVNELNDLAKKNQITLTDGISFETIKKEIQEDSSTNARGRRTTQNDEKANVYPALEAQFSLTGSYTNFRRFLYDLESNKMFFVIDDLTLETPDQEEKANLGGGPKRVSTLQSTTQNNGELTVQLRVKAYFHK